MLNTNEQKQLIALLSKVENIGFHTNLMKKTFEELETGDIVGIGFDLGIDFDKEVSYRIKAVGKRNGIGTNKRGVASLQFMINNVMIDNIDLSD